MTQGDKKPPQLLALLKKSQAFAESLLRENEQLSLRIGALEERVEAAERERDGLRARMEEVQLRSTANSERFQAIDEELNALANLHVATWQLHSTMHLREVVAVLVEICVNLVGADDLVVYLHDESNGALMPAKERMPEAARSLTLGEGDVGRVVAEGKVRIARDANPCVVVPLRLGTRIFGAVVVYRLLPQKEDFTDLDHQLFDLIAEQGASAVYGAYLAGATSTKLTQEAIQKQL